jgi:c-di-GMP-binding flagellar brake protein YcgR
VFNRAKTRETKARRDSELDAYRLDSAADVATMLRRLHEGDVQLNLNAPGGHVYTTTLWAMDAKRGVLSFAADARDPHLQEVLEADEAVVVGYLENIKIQFEVGNLVLVRGAYESALNTSYPGEIFRFQRRSSYRVRPILGDMPLARLRHPTHPKIQLELRILDVSITGCAMLLPADVPSLEPGTLIDHVVIELDPNTQLDATLRLQHIASIQPDSGALCLGCEIVEPTAQAQRTLQRYIDQTQKRRRFVLAG